MRFGVCIVEQTVAISHISFVFVVPAAELYVLQRMLRRSVMMCPYLSPLSTARVR
jgi:hypothetical protein